jgi:mannose-6-phosphate isomerase-like protein (cupin superfamily)
MKKIPTFEQFINESIVNENIATLSDNDIGMIINIDKETISNTNYRRVIFTAEKLQLVLMNIQPGDEIGEETHEDGDQFIRIEQGRCKVILNDEEYIAETDSGIIIKANVKHNIINIGTDELKVYSIYCPPEHMDGLMQIKKEI